MKALFQYFRDKSVKTGNSPIHIPQETNNRDMLRPRLNDIFIKVIFDWRLKTGFAEKFKPKTLGNSVNILGIEMNWSPDQTVIFWQVILNNQLLLTR